MPKDKKPLGEIKPEEETKPVEPQEEVKEEEVKDKPASAGIIKEPKQI